HPLRHVGGSSSEDRRARPRMEVAHLSWPLAGGPAPYSPVHAASLIPACDTSLARAASARAVKKPALLLPRVLPRALSAAQRFLARLHHRHFPAIPPRRRERLLAERRTGGGRVSVAIDAIA